MKRITIYALLLSILYYLSPVVAIAVDDPQQPPTYQSPVLITELQTGAGTASNEFVEIFNTSDEPIDITGWQIRYLNAASADNSTLLATVSNTEGAAVYLGAGEHYIFYTEGLQVPSDIHGQTYTAKLSSAAKTVGLYAANQQTCRLGVVDALAWGEGTVGEGSALNPDGSGDQVVQRLINERSFYVDTNDNRHDAAIARSVKDSLSPTIAHGATPGRINGVLLPTEESSPLIGQGSPLPDMEITGCTLPETQDPDNILEQSTEEPPSTEELSLGEDGGSGPVMPAANRGLAAPQITEILPNPGKPRTDVSDEFIELYNSNQSQFDLSGFTLEVGASTTKKRFTFPGGTILAGQSFKAYFSADTRLTLSNTKGQVYLLDPFGTVIASTEAYGTAKEDQAWAYAKSSWQWTTQPTPGSANHIIAPAAKKTAAKSANTSKSKSAGSFAGGSAAAASIAQSTPGEAQKTTLHTGVLALVGVFALLYGAYEYRSDVANKIHQFRLYRAARREARQGTKGR